MNNRYTLGLVVLLVILLGAYTLTKPRTNDTQIEVITDQSYYTIPELGIRLPNAESFADISYRVADLPHEAPGSKVVYFSSTKLVEKAREVGDKLGSRDCSAQDLGTAAKLTGYPAEPGPGLPGNPRDFGDFILSFVPSLDACTSNEQVWNVASAYINALENAFNSVETVDGKTGQVLEVGIIEGSFSYPSEGIPNSISACAESLSTQKMHCHPGAIEDTKFTYGTGYVLPLPIGKYRVFATTAENPWDPKAARAYFSEFVTCGLTAECKDHTPIVVEVKTDQTVSNIDPGDWYTQ
jgi:hypothetical protein